MDLELFESITPFSPGCSSLYPFSLAPVRDGYVTPKDPQKEMAAGNFSQVPILIGYNTDEGSMFVSPECTIDDFKSTTLYSLGPEASKAWWSRYPPDQGHTALERGREILAYSIITAGMKRAADLHSRYAKVYLYNYDYRTKESEKSGLGAYHTSELALVFGHPELMGYATPYELRLGDDMRGRWVNFIKTGNPSGGAPTPSPAAWAPYDPADPQVMRFGETVEMAPLPGREALDFVTDTIYGPAPAPPSK
jgi:para-nitrobenzyl esterase